MSLKKRDNFKKKNENRMIKLKEIKKFKININKKCKKIKKNLWDLLKKGLYKNYKQSWKN